MAIEQIDISENLTIEEKKVLYKRYFSNEHLEELQGVIESLIFKKKPPTPKEFLDPKNKWLPQEVVDGLYPHVKENILNILNEEKNYFQAVMYGATRCLHEDTPVIMWDLTIKPIKDIKIGDKVLGDDGSERTVLDTSKGKDWLYNVKQNKAMDYQATEDHTLVLQYTNKGLRKDRKNNEYSCSNKIIECDVSDYLGRSKTQKHLLKGIKPESLEFKEEDIILDPYLLGVYLGDGSKHASQITTMDKEISDYIIDYCKDNNLKYSILEKKNNKAKTYWIQHSKVLSGYKNYKDDPNFEKGFKTNNKFLNGLLFYNILNNKHIPKNYLKNSMDIRLKLLAGLIDSDGYKSSENNYEIVQKSDELTRNILFLCRSLGFRANSKKVEKKCTNTGSIGLYNRIQISGDFSKVPILLERKKSTKGKSKINHHRTGISINPGEKVYDNYVGLKVDGNERFLLEDLTIVHNSGKSYMVLYIVLYIIIFVHHLREPALYFGLAPNSTFSLFFLSFDFAKTREIYLSPLLSWMNKSDRFEKEHFEAKVIHKQREYGLEKIVFSTASHDGSEVTFASPLKIRLGNDDPMKVIGSNVICAFFSEISFFIENAGATEDQIFRIYSDTYARIKATVGNKYLAFVYLDSSANLADSQIEKYMLENLQFNNECYFRSYIQWEALKEVERGRNIFPKWYDRYWELYNHGLDRKQIDDIISQEGLTFKVFSGTGTEVPKILEENDNIKDFPSDKLFNVPIDYYPQFEQNITKSVKDIIGMPTSKESKFITNPHLISNIFDNDTLRNIKGGIIAGAEKNPQEMIWNEIKSKFFVSVDGESLQFYRSPRALRFFSVDQAFSSRGDLYGLTMCHLEWSREYEQNIVVVDFSFPLLPSDEGINLSAVDYLLFDLIYKGHISIHEFSTDSFQSERTLQDLKRMKINTIKRSVDMSLNPYMTVLNCMMLETLKSGYNIYLDNNLQCLEKVTDSKGKEKIDHPKGDTTDGKNAKDVSDSFANSIFGAIESKIVAEYIYEDENQKLSEDKNSINSNIDIALSKLVESQQYQLSFS